MRLDRAVALVTGASSGIGRAAALRVAARGASIVAVGRDAEALAELTRRTGGWRIRADLSDPSEVERVAGEAVAATGGVDVLVNSAGLGWAGPFAEMDPDRAVEVVAVNYLAPVRLTRLLLPGMLERRRGHVVNVASIAGHVGVRHEAVYAGTKAALIAFTESLRYELAGSGVGVSLVTPGAVRTAFFQRQGRPYDRRIPRLIDPHRVGLAVVRAIERDRPEVFRPRWMAVPARLRGALPGVYRHLASRFG